MQESLFLVTCPKGLVQLLNNELKRQGLKTFDSFDTGTFFRGTMEDCMKVNIRSRIGNVVYICLLEEKILDFDTLFESTKILPWKDYCSDRNHVSIEVNTYNSQLEAGRSIQAIVHKAVAESVGCMFPDHGTERDIYVHFKNDLCRIFVNTSGERLYKRGRRHAVGVAPLKENIAAGLVLLSGWKFREPLVDRCCGTGTILIEAAMIAKNIAPGLQRTFAFQDFWWYDSFLFDVIREEAKAKQFLGLYTLYGYDLNHSIVGLAQEYVTQMGLDDCIRIQQADATVQTDQNIIVPESYWMVTNPPYDKRIHSDDIDNLYDHLFRRLHSEKILWGGIYTGFDYVTAKEKEGLHSKSIPNGDIEAEFWWKW
jgi:putative N6-adenine-specific DNA methylase